MIDTLAVTHYGFASALASALFHALWQGVVLAVAAALALRALANAKAAWRHSVGMAFLVTMAIAPVWQFLRFWLDAGVSGGDTLLPTLASPLLNGVAALFGGDSSLGAWMIVILWSVGAGLMLARCIASLMAIAAAERSPYGSLPSHWRDRVTALRTAMRIARPVSVRLSDSVFTPWTARLARPVIWLPVSLLTRAPAEQIEALLAHELAHIARKDWLWNGVQCAVEALLFFHPGMWWLSRRVRQEREHACDDLAVAASGDPVALAEALAALEHERRGGLRNSPKLAVAAHGGSLMKRISRLLSEAPPRNRWGRLAILGGLTVSGVLALTQIGLAGGQLPDLVVRASTGGALGPGDYREITANGRDRQRYYRESLDAGGQRSEIYRENGRNRPIDAGVRAWIANVTRPVTFDHPAVSNIEDMAKFKSLVSQIGRHPAVAARLGVPVTMRPTPVNGNIRIGDDDGNAEIDIELGGPKGTAVVSVVAKLQGSDWTLLRVEPR